MSTTESKKARKCFYCGEAAFYSNPYEYATPPRKDKRIIHDKCRPFQILLDKLEKK